LPKNIKIADINLLDHENIALGRVRYSYLATLHAMSTSELNSVINFSSINLPSEEVNSTYKKLNF